MIEDNVDVTREFCDPKIFFSSTDKLLSFTLLDLDSRKVAMNVMAENDGSFYWVLPEGYYRVINVGYRTDIDPYVAFKIEGGNKYFYIGKIVLLSESVLTPHVSLRRHKARISTEYELMDVIIEDDFEYDANVLRARFPGQLFSIEKSLMFTNYDK